MAPQCDPLRDRLANRVQVTTGGQRPYLQATKVFQGDVDGYSIYTRAPNVATSAATHPPSAPALRSTCAHGPTRAHQHQLCRTSELDDAHARVHAPHQCVLKKV